MARVLNGPRPVRRGPYCGAAHCMDAIGEAARPVARDRPTGCRRGGAVSQNREPDGTGPVAWVDGRLVPADAPVLPVADRGFQLGDGVFETLRVRRGVAIELDLHLRRLREGLAVLEIRLPWSDAEMAGAIAATVAINAPEATARNGRAGRQEVRLAPCPGRRRGARARRRRGGLRGGGAACRRRGDPLFVGRGHPAARGGGRAAGCPRPT